MGQNVCFPGHGRIAKMIIISKTKLSLVEQNGTRSIPIFPYFITIYEKLFLTHFTKWISDNGILSGEQTVFRPRPNRSARIVSIINQIGQGSTLNTGTAAIFNDFKTTFNQLWIKGL